MEQALIEIAKQLPSAGLLIIAVRWLLKRNEILEQKNAALQLQLLAQEKENSKTSRDAEKEAIEVINEVTTAMKELNNTLKYAK